jgi:hypothetical protein
MRDVHIVRSKRNPHLVLCTDGEFHTPAFLGPGGYKVKIYRNRRVYRLWDTALFDVCFAILYDDGRLELPPPIIQRAEGS